MAFRRAAAAGVMACVLLVAVPPSAADGTALVLEGSLDGRTFNSISANEPMRLQPERGVVVAVSVTNNGPRTVEVRSVRLDAEVVGLVFFTYTTRVDLTLAPGETGQRTFALDIADLGDQATGLLPAQVTLLDPAREPLVSRATAVDVRGSAASVYGVFAVAIAGITALLLVGLLIRLAAHRLPANRFSRAWRFAVAGVGLGLVATFTLSVLRVLLPSRERSAAVVIVTALVAFGLGYLSPSQDDRSGRDDLFEDDFAQPDEVGPAPARTGTSA